jgi:hypothetical protein
MGCGRELPERVIQALRRGTSLGDFDDDTMGDCPGPPGVKHP